MTHRIQCVRSLTSSHYGLETENGIHLLNVGGSPTEHDQPKADGRFSARRAMAAFPISTGAGTDDLLIGSGIQVTGKSSALDSTRARPLPINKDILGPWRASDAFAERVIIP